MATRKARSRTYLAQRIGRFELANRGTVFLDEAGEMPLELQKIDADFENRAGMRDSVTTRVFIGDFSSLVSVTR